MKRIISEGLLSQKFCNRNVCDKEGFRASGGAFHLNGAAVIWQAQGQLCARFHLESNTHIYLCN